TAGPTSGCRWAKAASTISWPACGKGGPLARRAVARGRRPAAHDVERRAPADKTRSSPSTSRTRTSDVSVRNVWLRLPMVTVTPGCTRPARNTRSEERRVGKEGRAGGARDGEEKTGE